jgi:hypothetical protein
MDTARMLFTPLRLMFSSNRPGGEGDDPAVALRARPRRVEQVRKDVVHAGGVAVVGLRALLDAPPHGVHHQQVAHGGEEPAGRHRELVLAPGVGPGGGVAVEEPAAVPDRVVAAGRDQLARREPGEGLRVGRGVHVDVVG